MTAIAYAVNAAIVIGTILLTGTQYRHLPSRVPLHFGITGKADNFGSRPLIWLIPGVQLAFALLYTVLYLTGHSRGMLVIGVGVSTIFLWTQMQILRAAANGSNRIPAALFWAVWIAIAAVTVAALELWSSTASSAG